MSENKPRGRTKRVMTEAVKQGERIQQNIDAKDKKKPTKENETAVHAGTRPYPDHFPSQHLRKPGIEADLKVAPMYQAPGYKGSDKLKDMVAIITGGDSGIGRSVANDISDISDQHFDRTLKTNLYGYFYMARAAVPKMKSGGAIASSWRVPQGLCHCAGW